MIGQQPVLVIGGTRGTGLLIVRLLQQRGHRVRVLVRNPQRALTLFDSSAEVMGGDLTKPETLPAAINGVRHIFFTAGCRSGYLVREPRVKAVEYEGVIQTLAAARHVGFTGRLLYMTSSGVLSQNFATRCLNFWKGKTLLWRRRVEEDIRASGIDYTIIRTGVLLNRPGGEHVIQVTQQPLPLAWRYRIARADVAEIFLAALQQPKASRTTFEAVWASRGEPKPLEEMLAGLQPDADLRGLRHDVA
jgi:uncharacterized protein YbjT (DUF2867 family)